MDLIQHFLYYLESFGFIGLIILSFAESSFFPVPPDLLLIPMALADRKFALIYAFLTTVSSVCGGVFGYVLGKKFGKPLLRKVFKESQLEKVQRMLQRYGGWSVTVAGLTPIPYKIFTISAGVFDVRLSVFIMSSIIGRGIRFFSESLLIVLLGDISKYYIDRYFNILTIVGMLLIIMIYYGWKKLKAIGIVNGTGIGVIFRNQYDKIFHLMLKYKNSQKHLIYVIWTIVLTITIFITADFILDTIK